MTTDLEARLMRAMHGATRPDDLLVDPESIIDDGRKAVRRRRTVIAGGIVAAVAVLALAASVFTSLPQRQIHSSVPAATPTTSAIQIDRWTATPEGDFSSSGVYDVSFTPGTGTIGVSLEDDRERRRVVTEWRVADIPRTSGLTAGIRRLGDGEYLVVLPEDARSVSTTTRRATTEVSSGPDMKRLPGSRLAVGIAVLVKKDADLVTGVRWRQGDAVLSTTGGHYRTARLPGADDAIVWTADDGSTGLMSTGEAVSWPPRPHLEPGVQTVSLDPSPGGRGATATAVAVVPVGATDLAFDWPTGWTAGPVSSVRIPGRPEVLVLGTGTASATVKKDLSDLRLAWTDAQGRHHIDK